MFCGEYGISKVQICTENAAVFLRKGNGGVEMKKKVANAVELILLIVSFIMLWLPLISLQYTDLLRPMPITASVIGITTRRMAYALFALYGINAFMCLLSVITKKEHRDGKLHAIMPIILFLYCATGPNTSVGEVHGDWIIVASSFPTYLFLALMLGVVAVGFIKRTALIAGVPVIEVKNTDTAAGELKKYKELLDTGAITQEEYDVKKTKLLK